MDAASLHAASERLRLPTPPATAEDVTRARDVATRLTAKPAPAFLDQVKALRVLDTVERENRPLEAEVQIITLGRQVAWVALPGEIFVELGQAIKQRSPFPTTVVVELANGAIGYVPNQAAYAQGAYEVASARCAEGSGEMLVDAALRLLAAAHRER